MKSNLINNNSIDKKPKIWFATHDVISYLNDPNKIICGFRTENRRLTDKPVIPCFKEIALGDKVVYYAFERHLILGLFQIVSELKSGTNYNNQKIQYYDVERLSRINDDGFLDVAKLAEQGKDKFEAFEHGILCTNGEDVNAVKEIGEADYAKIEQYLNQKKLLSRIEIDEKKVELLSASLDFFGSRATSFASLFVASIFGIVTLSAIIQGLNSESLIDLLILHLSMIPFAFFAVAGWYTLQKYFHYGDIAERIRYWGLTFPYYKDLREIKEIKYTTTNGIVTSKTNDLVNCLLVTEKEKGTKKEKQKVNVSNLIITSIKQVLSAKSSFSILYFLLLFLIYIVVYYHALT